MSKVFTIAEGLENMGALRTGGQGSVYKGRRIGPIISAVKILPTPIQSEDETDKNYRAFQNEVEKLKKVNEIPNPNVVKILNSGVTESGSFPFIEMEYIEGPDLGELLAPPHEKIFSLKELIKVADQLACALAHCHKAGVKHGDIKSNNIKFNIHTGNYMLLDFGLSIMSDEQRRTSIRHAGAIEFMAPEQNEGKMLFQTDVYSYGVILYELLAGQVPFPLKDNGETARNTVMIAHMESPVPDVVKFRKVNFPDSWTGKQRQAELAVPAWLLALINKCLEKTPENRFANGMELHDAVADNRIMDAVVEEIKKVEPEIVEQPKVVETPVYQQSVPGNVVQISKPLFAGLMFLLVALAGFTVYSLISRHTSGLLNTAQQKPDSAQIADSIAKQEAADKATYREKKRISDSLTKAAIEAEIKRRQEFIPDTTAGVDSTGNQP